ncbi:MAG: glutamine--fructose-6-phosphate transaminase (isomerizing) [Deltaproteobacteria bacterium]|nr:glutamine--fructose-6-phosphate transaminase (isomerizing) [Candidatus Anaeroferrophillus wilburensis]MBN2889086.1 glutamine--fructose-6-phosphate transaminase (isomerizing) [Deltaproteobacteria bacterium]
MCGIVGYMGPQDGVPVVMDGLHKLEYRGYDSAGIATFQEGRIVISRSVGKLRQLEQKLLSSTMAGSPTIGHTRWATHGRPTEPNAHPHAYKGVVVVHNGIIENYVALRRELEAEGNRFASETDTEIISHLIARELGGGAGLPEAVRKALHRVRGAFALGILYEKTPEMMIAARKGSPLVVAYGEQQGEYYLASDIPALLAYSREVIFLDDDEMAVCTPGGMTISRIADGREEQKEVHRITWDPIMAEKGGYKHFMLKEIFEQPQAVSNTLLGRISEDRQRVDLQESGFSADDWRQFNKVVILACGTSWHAGLVGKFWFEKLARIPTEVDIASEFRYREPLVDESTLLVGISQSGETADTLAALQEGKRRGAKIFSICNVMGSSIARQSDGVLYTHAGPEIGVASTKAFTTQLACLMLLALDMAAARGSMAGEEIAHVVDQLLHLPVLMEKVLERAPRLENIARNYHHATDYLYLARGLNYPIALEGALKLKEISYIHAEGYPAGEMKHGPIALIDEQMPVVVLAPHDRHYEKVLSNLQEVVARDGKVIAFTADGDEQVGEHSAEVVFVEEPGELLNPLVYTVPLQLLAYYTAVFKGTDVDQPRNLAKSVTVE